MDQVILSSLRRRNIKAVYHFIGLPYLPNLIVRGGLYCARRLREWGDPFDDDRQKWGSYTKGEAFSPYVSCSVNPPMGMLTRDKQPVILELIPSVAAIDNVAFIGKWSSFNDILAEDAVQQTGVEWFDRMFLNPDTGHANPHPGEFLVPAEIPLASLRRLVFFTEANLQSARESLGPLDLPPGVKPLAAAVEPHLFGRKMQEEGNQP